MNKTYLLLGSNMGNSTAYLLEAQEYLEREAGRIIRRSDLYRTSAWGNEDQPDFVNQVIEMSTELPPEDLMNIILNIEEQMGRIRTEKNAPRIIDIDILFYNKSVIQKPLLMIPHPAIQLRRFVLVPLNQLIPGYIHPVFNRTVKQLLKECPDKLDVKKI